MKKLIALSLVLMSFSIFALGENPTPNECSDTQCDQSRSYDGKDVAQVISETSAGEVREVDHI